MCGLRETRFDREKHRRRSPKGVLLPWLISLAARRDSAMRHSSPQSVSGSLLMIIDAAARVTAEI